eukprot:277240-Chlamydomonas_euryale.AAC.8
MCPRVCIAAGNAEDAVENGASPQRRRQADPSYVHKLVCSLALCSPNRLSLTALCCPNRLSPTALCSPNRVSLTAQAATLGSAGAARRLAAPAGRTSMHVREHVRERPLSLAIPFAPLPHRLGSDSR